MNTKTIKALRILGVIVLIVFALSITGCSAAFNQSFANGLGQSQGQRVVYVQPQQYGTTQTITTRVGNTTYSNTFGGGTVQQQSYTSF